MSQIELRYVLEDPFPLRLEFRTRPDREMAVIGGWTTDFYTTTEYTWSEWQEVPIVTV